jgi:hypothetical protein
MRITWLHDRLDLSAESNRHQHRQNKALHPTAYSSARSYLRFRRPVSLSLARSDHKLRSVLRVMHRDGQKLLTRIHIPLIGKDYYL